MKIKISRTIDLPDPVKIERFRRSPDLGPKILFFTGGTALRKSCFELVRYTHNSIHIITPFDSGGSSAVLRTAFEMPAIGDVRNRLLALADQSFKGNPEIFNLFSHRFSSSAENQDLLSEFNNMIQGNHPLIAAVHDPMRKIIRHYLERFKDFMPGDFDLKKASIGNLILTGGYLDAQRRIDSIVYVFSMLVKVRGTVRPVVNKNFHLAARMENGEVIIGQHLITGKEVPPITQKIDDIFLTGSLFDPSRSEVEIRTKMESLINSAEIICYPMGSFYSSLIASLLPRGVGTAISRTPCPKIFIPNTADDPESFGMTLADQVDTLIRYLCKNHENEIAVKDVLNLILIDRQNAEYRGEIDEDKYKDMGIRFLDTNLVSKSSHPFIDEKLLVPLLLSLV